MTSSVSIANQAIGWVGGNLITSFDDDADEARLINANFDDLRKAVLESADWTFATRRFRMVPDSTPPEFGYINRFLINPLVLRVLTASTDVTSDNNDVDWIREEDYILSDESVLYMRGIIDITDPVKWSPNFGQALAARIAADLAIPIAGSRKLQEDMWSLFERKSGLATTLDGKQGKSQKMKSEGWSR